MKIGKPTGLVPDSGSRDDGKYADIYKAVDKLQDGQWLPVSFNSRREAYNFRLAVETHRTRVMEGKMRGNTVYVRMGKKRTEDASEGG